MWNLHKIFSVLSWESDSSAISTPENDPQATLCRLSLGPHWPTFPPRSRAVRGSASTAKLKGRKLPKIIQLKQNLCVNSVESHSVKTSVSATTTMKFDLPHWLKFSILFSIAAIIICNVNVGITSICYNFALLKLCTVYIIFIISNIEWWIWDAVMWHAKSNGGNFEFFKI